MDTTLFTRRSEYEWEIARHGAMRVPALIYASEPLIREMDQKVYEQAVNVATLPGIVKASYADRGRARGMQTGMPGKGFRKPEK